MDQNRFKSPVVWASIVAQVLSILVLTGVIVPTLSDTINTVVGSVLQMLVVLGVLNNPENSSSF
jgi:uncharacterized membrane protein